MGQQKETLLLTYNAIGRSIDRLEHQCQHNKLCKIHVAQNDYLRIAICSHAMANNDHLIETPRC